MSSRADSLAGRPCFHTLVIMVMQCIVIPVQIKDVSQQKKTNVNEWAGFEVSRRKERLVASSHPELQFLISWSFYMVGAALLT